MCPTPAASPQVHQVVQTRDQKYQRKSQTYYENYSKNQSGERARVKLTCTVYPENGDLKVS